MSTVCDPFQPHFRNANVSQKGSRNMSSPASRPGTSRNQSMLYARINSAHSAGERAQNFVSRLQFLNHPTASIPPPMSLISKERFSPNTGTSPFYISERDSRCTPNGSTVAGISSPPQPQFLNRHSASISPRMCLISKERFRRIPAVCVLFSRTGIAQWRP